MDESHDLLSQLRALIATRIYLHGDPYQVIEVLPEGPVIVLQALDAEHVIQANAQGEASRRVPRLVEIEARLGGEETLDPRVAGWLRQVASTDQDSGASS